MEKNGTDIDLESISILIPKSKNGDSAARDQLLSEMQDFLRQVARKNLSKDLQQKIGESDVVQMSFLRVIENFDKFRGKSSAEFRGWLKTIVVNEMHGIRRGFHTAKRDIKKEQPLAGRDSTAPGFTAIDSELTPSSEAIAAERVQLFHAVVDELAPDHAEVIRLRSIEELSFKEIAERMNRSADAVSQMWYRAMLKLEERIKLNKNFISRQK